ncbi:MAG: cupin domain-containing protein, partial [Hyphomicrobiales bacterium]|nr:cupin domain-containing protein [Hyphomicrobiales bacterium]
MSEPITTFARLLAPISYDQFFDEYYEKKPLHIEGSRDKVANVCSWGEFNELIHRTGIWSDQTFKMVIDTERVPAHEFCTRAPGRDGMSLFIPASHKVQQHLDNGASIVLDLIETLTPGIRAVTEALQMALATRISCNAYCSQNQRRAFPSHFDTMEVFALHIEGAKTWRVYESRFADPLEMDGYVHTSFSPDHHDKAKGGVLM